MPAWAEGIDGGIFTAVSDDGIEWTKSPEPVLDLDVELDCGMVSEPCVIESAGWAVPECSTRRGTARAEHGS